MRAKIRDESVYEGKQEGPEIRSNLRTPHSTPVAHLGPALVPLASAWDSHSTKASWEQVFMLVGAAQDVSKICIEDIVGFTFEGTEFLVL